LDSQCSQVLQLNNKSSTVRPLWSTQPTVNYSTVTYRSSGFMWVIKMVSHRIHR